MAKKSGTIDKMIWNNKEYELAKNTMKIARLVEAAESAETMVEAYACELGLVAAALGRDTAADILGTVEIEDVDLGTLVMVYNAVIEGYEKRIADMRASQEEKLFNSPTIRGVGKLADDVKVLKSIEGGRK